MLNLVENLFKFFTDKTTKPQSFMPRYKRESAIVLYYFKHFFLLPETGFSCVCLCHPETQSINQASLELSDLPVSVGIEGMYQYHLAERLSLKSVLHSL